MFDALISGFLLGLSLIVAIGAQNAFVLKQGIKGHYVFWVCSICAVSDAILIAVGVFFLTAVERYIPAFAHYAKYFGALFLLLYGCRSLIAAFQQKIVLEPDKRAPKDFAKTLFFCLGLTWLNPHVYLDTVVLLGSISIQYGIYANYFGAGAIVSSLLFFFALGYGAIILRPLFAKPITWKILDVIIAIIMWSIAFALLRR